MAIWKQVGCGEGEGNFGWRMVEGAQGMGYKSSIPTDQQIDVLDAADKSTHMMNDILISQNASSS